MPDRAAIVTGASRGIGFTIAEVVSVRLPTLHGEFDAVGYHAPLQGMEFIAVVRGDYAGADRVPVSVREGCIVGDALHTAHCGCGIRLGAALEHLAARPRGILIRLEPDVIALSQEHPPLDPCRIALVVQVIRDLGPRSVVLVDTDDELQAMLLENGCPVAA